MPSVGDRRAAPPGLGSPRTRRRREQRCRRLQWLLATTALATPPQGSKDDFGEEGLSPVKVRRPVKVPEVERADHCSEVFIHECCQSGRHEEQGGVEAEYSDGIVDAEVQKSVEEPRAEHVDHHIDESVRKQRQVPMGGFVQKTADASSQMNGEGMSEALMREIRDWVYDEATGVLAGGEVLPISYMVECMEQAVRKAVGEWSALKMIELERDLIVAAMSMDGEWMFAESGSSEGSDDWDSESEDEGL